MAMRAYPTLAVLLLSNTVNAATPQSLLRDIKADKVQLREEASAVIPGGSLRANLVVTHRQQAGPASRLSAEMPLASAAAAGATARAGLRTRGRVGTRGTAGSAEGQSKWKDPSFFGAFSEGESTYDDDAPASLAGEYKDGWQPDISDPFRIQTVRSEWFDESPSGDGVAWQTHFPALKVGAAGQTEHTGSWTQDSAGVWSEQYKEQPNNARNAFQSGTFFGKLSGRDEDAEALPPGWFENSMNQLDSFGRYKLPESGTAKRLQGLGWQERTVNATLSCAQPGCTASTVLNVFNSATERVAHCRLDVQVVPTDFDANATAANVTKQVDWIAANGAFVSVACLPQPSGCGVSGDRPAFPCAADVVLDGVMSTTGTLNVTAKIAAGVSASSCAYQGNLLYAVPTVTCFVQNSNIVPPEFAPGSATSS